jgi:hypothetical protein
MTWERFVWTGEDGDACRLRVEDDRGNSGFITIADEELASRGPKARVLAVRGAIDLETTEAEWLRDQLVELLGPGDRGGAAPRDSEAADAPGIGAADRSDTAVPKGAIASFVGAVQLATCQHFQIPLTNMASSARHKSVAFARHVAMYLCKRRLKCSFPEIGRAFGNRHHTTVMSAVRKIAAEYAVDSLVRAHVDAIDRRAAAA